VTDRRKPPAVTLATASLVALTLAVTGASSAGRASTSATVCPPAAAVFNGVYHQARFKLLNPCKTARGVIRFIKPEDDGDLHMRLELDAGQENLLNQKNVERQDGKLVLELMPRDAGHIPRPQVGWRVTVTGAWVTDGKQPNHGWNEIHPVFRLRHAGKTYRSGPQFGGDPDSARSSNALALCKTEANAPCPGY
jgi:hypothetical protein